MIIFMVEYVMGDRENILQKELVNEENELAKVLREKYGDGTYDVQTNTFTPNK